MKTLHKNACTLQISNYIIYIFCQKSQQYSVRQQGHRIYWYVSYCAVVLTISLIALPSLRSHRCDEPRILRESECPLLWIGDTASEATGRKHVGCTLICEEQYLL